MIPMVATSAHLKKQQLEFGKKWKSFPFSSKMKGKRFYDEQEGTRGAIVEPTNAVRIRLLLWALVQKGFQPFVERVPAHFSVTLRV